MNLYGGTPLAGVQLFNRSTYPKDLCIFLRGNQDIYFDVHNIVIHKDSLFKGSKDFYKVVSSNSFYFYGSPYCVSEVYLRGRTFWATSSWDTLSFSLKKPIFTELEDLRESSKVDQSAMEFLIREGLYATSLSPVDLVWLLGKKGQKMTLFGDREWGVISSCLPSYVETQSSSLL